MRDKFLYHLLFSIIVKAIPCYICFMLCLIRYFNIKNDGINLKTKYSRLTWSKLYLSYGMSFAYLLPILFALTIKSYWLHEKWGYAFLYIIYS